VVLSVILPRLGVVAISLSLWNVVHRWGPGDETQEAGAGTQAGPHSPIFTASSDAVANVCAVHIVDISCVQMFNLHKSAFVVDNTGSFAANYDFITSDKEVVRYLAFIWSSFCFFFCYCWSDLNANFTKDVLVDKEELIKFWKSGIFKKRFFNIAR